MKLILVLCTALVLALTPAAGAEAAKGKGKSGKANAAKTCSAKKAKGKKAKKARKACKKAAKKTAAPAPRQAAAEKECRADRRIDGEGFAADFGTGRDAVATCAAELLEQTAGSTPEGDEDTFDDETLEGEDAGDEPVSDDEAQFGGEEELPAEDPLL